MRHGSLPRFRAIEKPAPSRSATTGPNLLYGQGSNAWELTFTPTYQYKIFFARTELSYIAAGGSNTAGNAFGDTGNKKNQFRALVEAGFVF